MTQYVINIGAIPNDGTGDPLRTAFNETNLNFDQVFAAGPVLSNVQIANNTILTTNTNGNLVLAPNGTGVVQSNVSIVPNLANLRNLGSATNRWATVYTQYVNSTQINLTGDLTVGGNLTVSGNIIEMGNIVTDALTIQLANTATTANAANGAGITVGANDNIAHLLYRPIGNFWAMNVGLTVLGFANVAALSINQSANSWVIEGNILTAPSGAFWNSNPVFKDEYITSARDGYINLTSLYANGNTASQIHLEHGLAQIIVDNGTEYIWEFDDSGNITLPSNIASINYANGSPYGGSGENYGNANVVTLLAGFGSNTISTTGNVTSGNVLTGGLISATGNATAGNIRTAGAVVADTLYVNQTANFWGISGNVITAPSGATWTSNVISKDEYITSAANGYINLTSLYANSTVASQIHLEHGLAQIIVDNGVNDYIWEFDNDGTTQFPGNVIQAPEGLPITVKSTNGNASTRFEAGADYAQIGLQDDTTGAYQSWAYLETDMANVNTPSAAVILKPGDTGTEVRWTYNSDGTTIFPTLTVDLHNGGTQTGQVLQFGDGNQQAIITGPAPIVEGYNAQRLIIQGQNGNTGEGGDVYVWGGDSQFNGGDIKIYAGDADNGASGVGGNIHISGGSGQNTGGEISLIGGVTYDGQGAPVVVAGGRGSTTGGAVSLDGGYGDVNGGDINITGGIGGNGLGSYGNVGISAGSSSWAFDNTGNLTLPQAGVVYETNIPFGGLEGKTIALKPYGGTNADQQLLVYPTAGADFNHLHLTSGNLYNTELFLGSDDLYVKLANTGNIVINANDSIGNTAQWTFGTAGNLSAPGNISAVGNITSGNIVTSGSGGDITLTSGNITGANVVSANTFVSNAFNVVTAGNLSITSQYGLGFTGTILEDNGTLELIANGSGCVVIGWDSTYGNGLGNIASINFNEVGGGEGNILLRTGNRSATEYNWNFDSTGNLTLPGGMVISGNTNFLGTDTALLNPADNTPLSLFSSGANGTVTSFWTDDVGNLMTSNIAALYLPLQGTQTVRIVNGNNSGNVAIYDFGNDGVFTTAQVSAAGNVTAGNFIGTSANVTLVAGAYTSVFDNTGNLTVPGNIVGSGGSKSIDNIKIGFNTPASGSFTDIGVSGSIQGSASAYITMPGYASITGNITGGNISTAGNVTASSLNGNANISNVTVNSYTFVPQLWFKGTLSTDQSLTTSNDTVILYNTNSDPLSWGGTAGSNGQIKPTKAGWYEVVSRVQFSAIAGNTSAQINHQILVNGVQQAISQVPNNAVVGAGVAVVATAMVNLNGTTDYITTSCYTTVAGQTCVGSNSTMLLVKWVST